MRKRYSAAFKRRFSKNFCAAKRRMVMRKFAICSRFLRTWRRDVLEVRKAVLPENSCDGKFESFRFTFLST